jgi:6-phosphofructokinase
MPGTSRENPTPSRQAIQAVIETLQQAGITHLMTIGGDDTAPSLRYVSEHSTGTIHSVHVPLRSTTTCRYRRTCPRSAFRPRGTPESNC